MTSLIDVAIANCRLLCRDQTLTVVCHTRLSHPESAAIRCRPRPNQRQLRTYALVCKHCQDRPLWAVGCRVWLWWALNATSEVKVIKI